jgi:hypothetical protein
MTEVSRLNLSEEFTPDLADEPPARSDQKKPVREGLPPTYRMRADAHYVDQLTTGRGERQTHDAAGRTDRLLAQLAENLATIESAAELLGGERASVGRRVNLDLIRAEASRASWMIRAYALAQGAHAPQIRRRPLGFLLSQVRARVAAECRLAGVLLAVHASEWEATVAVDEAIVVTGLAGAVHALLGLFEPGEAATIKIRAVATGGQLRSVDVSQDEVLIQSNALRRFFDAAWADRPGGWVAALGAAAARAAAQQHGGDALVIVNDSGGTTLHLSFDRAMRQ